MDNQVIKIGMPFFDALHTYGLATLLTTTTGLPVTVQDEGMCYRLSTSCGENISAAPGLLEAIWQVPTTETLSLSQTDYRATPLARANLDGLLAAVFTQTGPRVVSVADLLLKARRSVSLLTQGLQKVQRSTAQWKCWAEQAGYGTPSWLEEVLQAYRFGTPAPPTFNRARKHKDLSLWMTLEPSLGFSTRRPWSDCLINDQTTLTLSSPRYSVLLARVGAARFLRAQPVAGHLINFYLPLARTLTLHAESALPILPALILPSDQATIAGWLNFVRAVSPLEATWDALAYQVLQVQGTHAPAARQSGVLPFDWITTITGHLGYGLIHFWRSVLQCRQEDTAYPVDALLSALLSHHPDAWMAYFREHTWAAQMDFQERIWRYSFQECKELIDNMTLSTTSPLRSILERKEGTLRFGRALRLLGQVNHASLVETLDLLEQASTLEQLIPILSQAVLACRLASAKSKFVVIPNEEDLKYVGDDVAQHGVRLVANLLLILSVLRYPPVTTPGAENDTQLPSLTEEDAAQKTREVASCLADEGDSYDI